MNAFARVRSLIMLICAAASTPALGQSAVLQGGPWTPGHAPMYVGRGSSQPVIQDSGPASGGAAGLGLSELGITARGTGTPPYVGQGTGPFGTNVCDYDAPTTNATGYHFLCFSANAQGGGGMIAYGAGGTATPGSLNINVNGVNYPFPGAGSGSVVGPATTTVGNIALWNNTNGTLLSGLPAGTSSQVLIGGTTPSWGPVPAAAIPAPTLGITRSQIPTTAIASVYNSFITAGYAAVFDGGEGCEWTRATVSAPGAVQSADGAYWALSRDSAIDIKCVGGLTTSSDIYDALIAASNIAKDPSSGSFGLITLSGKYPGGGGTAGYTLNTPGFPLANAQSLSGCQAGKAFLNYTQTSGNALTTAIYPSDSSIECMEMQIQNPTNTATAIQIGNAAYSGGAMFTLRDSTILNYDTGIRAFAGSWYIQNVKVTGYYDQGVEISNPPSPDGGNWVINRLSLDAATTHAANSTGIRWYSSNGGIISNTTTYGGTYGVDASMADYAGGGSLVFTGNIIGNADLYGLRFSHQGAGQMGSIVITGNDLPGIPGNSVLFEAGAVSDAVFAGNTCGPQPWGTVPLVIENGNTFITIGVNDCFFPNGFADYRTDYNEGGDVHREMTYPHITTSDAVTWKSAWRLQVSRHGGGVLQVTTEGYVTGDASFVREDEFIVNQTGPGTLTCVSKSSTTTGAAIGVQCDTASEPDAVHIRYRTSGPGTTLNGTMSVRTQGHFSRMDGQF